MASVMRTVTGPTDRVVFDRPRDLLTANLLRLVAAGGFGRLQRRVGNLHPGLSNVVFVGSGTQPGVGVPMVLISGKLAAARITGAAREP